MIKVGTMVRVAMDAKAKIGDKYPGWVDDMARFGGKVGKVSYRHEEHEGGACSFSIEGFDGWLWPASALEEIGSVSITVSGNNKAELREAFNAKLKTIPTAWTEADNIRAKDECLALMADHLEGTQGMENIVFSSLRDGRITHAAFALTGGLWTLMDHEAIATATLREGEKNMPWIGRLIAACRLLHRPVPSWITEKDR